MPTKKLNKTNLTKLGQSFLDLPAQTQIDNTRSENRVIAGRTARCRCKFRYVSKFTAASRGFHCVSTGFDL